MLEPVNPIYTGRHHITFLICVSNSQVLTKPESTVLTNQMVHVYHILVVKFAAGILLLSFAALLPYLLALWYLFTHLG